jgi:pimeloyl-ACP methyl ester carboxylesterase
MLGQGPAIVLIQGTVNTAYNFRDLAKALAGSFTVIVPDRRGRGLSEPGNAPYHLDREIEDVAAVLEDTRARLVFGLSSGALIALQAALRLPQIEKVMAFEPPLFTPEALPARSIADLDGALDRSDLSGALVAGMKAGGFGPPWMLALPNRVLKWMLAAMPQPKAAPSRLGGATMQELAPTLRNDFAIVKALAGSHEVYRGLHTPTLLLRGGETTQPYLRSAFDSLAAIIPGCESVTIAGVDHSGPLNRGPMGKPGPDQVAEAIRAFALPITS